MKAEKILFITQEIDPYVPESDLTVLGRNLPIDALEQNREIRAFMPKWGNINERRNQLHEVIRLSGLNIIVNDTDHQLIIKVASIVGTRMQVYFIDNEDFFGKRLAELDREGKEYGDNPERMAFYARGVLETVKKLRWTPDVIHCQGWISALVPVYLKTAYAEEPSFRDCKVVFSVTDNKLTAATGDNFAQVFGYRNAGAQCIEEFGASLTPNELLKLAVKYSDGVTFAHPNEEVEAYAVAKEIPIYKGEYNSNNILEFFDGIWNTNRKVNPED